MNRKTERKDILVKKNATVPHKSGAKKCRVSFSVRAEAGAQVFLSGDFNAWNPSDKEMTDKTGDGLYSAALFLAPGDYQYKFVIDGTWCVDPECPDWVPNEHGTLNSLRHVV